MKQIFLAIHLDGVAVGTMISLCRDHDIVGIIEGILFNIWIWSVVFKDIKRAIKHIHSIPTT